MATDRAEIAPRPFAAETPRLERSVCALLPYPVDSAPSQRFRIEQWIPVLAASGIRVDLYPFAPPPLVELLHAPGRPVMKSVALAAAFGRRVLSLPSLKNYDAVLVHRAASLVGPAVLERVLSARRPLIFDFDDAIFLTHTTSANRRFGWLKFARKTATICRLSAHVVAGNEYLASYARHHASRVTVIPSSVDTERYCPAVRTRTSPVVVGWMGTSTSQMHLEMFSPALRDLSRRRAVEIRVVSDRRPHLPDVPFVWRNWTAATELEELREFDIGIMPMPDDPWSAGKCAMKALLYMSVGAATVCSPVGMNRDVITHGENGLLADSPEAWVECLDRVVDDAGLRRRLGDAGRVTVETRYSKRRCASLLAGVIEQTVKDGR